MNDEKIEKQTKKLFDRIRRLSKTASEEKLKELDELFKQKSKGEGKISAEFCLTGLEITMDQLMDVYNDISNRTNCPFKYARVDLGRRQK